MNINRFSNIYIIFLFIIFPFSLKSQISIGGIPPGFAYDLNKSLIQTINIEKPDVAKLLLEDEISGKKGEAYRMGILLPVDKGIHNSGTWTRMSNGDKIWQLRITSKDALATGFYFDNFHLPAGSRLYVYNDEKTNLIGAFTDKNNHTNGYFATSLIAGDAAILEYFEPFVVKDTVILNISEINYAYRGVNIISTDKNGFGSSGSCEVNANCSEGNDWKLQKGGVVRINIRVGSSTSWCTGALVNNTLNDFKPYMLTADHCGHNASAANISQWIFYFNYESDVCSNPTAEGTLSSHSMTGAVKVASGGNSGNTGSDFYLVLLNNEVPKSYNPYFQGWDRSGNASASGVSIHHPEGDIKKISTYNTPLVSSAYNTVFSHWKVVWNATANGHGVTEPGSSGSPIFNASGRLVGTLTGGTSSCSFLSDPDFYGKFDWHWDKNGSTPAEHLKEWLDPGASNVMQLEGLAHNSADFTANTTYVKKGETVQFTNTSLGVPSQYLWQFENGEPAFSTQENPVAVRYNETGFQDVSLTTFFVETDTSYSRLTTKPDYIRVWDDVKMYAPSLSGQLWIDFSYTNFEKFNLSIYDVMGRNVLNYENNSNPNTRFNLNISKLRTGVYIVKIITDWTAYENKVVIIN